MTWSDGIIDSMDTSLSKLPKTVKDREAGMPQSMGVQRVGHDWATEQQPPPAVKTPCFHCRGAQVQSLVHELRSHVL